MLIIFYYVVIKGMVLNDGLSHLDHLLQESLRYHHEKENYKIILQEEILTASLKIKKDLGFVPLTGQFNKKWDSVLFDAEKSLEELLLTESDNAFKNIGTKFNQE